jgi:hypothetical protein
MLAFGIATSSDVPEVVLQVPDEAAQLMVDPLLGRSILCFKGRIIGDVLRHVFGPNDFLRERNKAKRNKEEVKREDHTRKQEAS